MTMQLDSRQRIINSARDLIFGSSYADVGVAKICEHAGVKKGSFYHFFASKQQLTLEMIDDMRQMMEVAVLQPAFAADIPPMQRLSRFVQALYEFQLAAAAPGGIVLGCPFGNLALELSTSDEPIRKKLESVFSVMEVYIRKALDDAQVAGDLPGIDVNASAYAMLAFLEGVLMMAKVRHDPELIRSLGVAVSDIRIQENKGQENQGQRNTG